MRQRRPARHLLLSVVGVIAALSVPAPAAAGGGDYFFDGGSERARAQVRRALDASSFDWNAVPARIEIHIAPGSLNRSVPGHIWLDEHLLAAGRFSWAVVQDEYAHQVDFFLLDQSRRSALTPMLGAKAWSRAEAAGLKHSEYGAERFASTLVWSYWPSRDNAYRPRSRSDESAALAPAAFRALVSTIVLRPSA